MAHPFAQANFGFSVLGARTLYWGGCAWDSFAIPHLVPHEPRVVVATTCPTCDRALAWVVETTRPPEATSSSVFAVPAARAMGATSLPRVRTSASSARSRASSSGREGETNPSGQSSISPPCGACRRTGTEGVLTPTTGVVNRQRLPTTSDRSEFRRRSGRSSLSAVRPRALPVAAVRPGRHEPGVAAADARRREPAVIVLQAQSTQPGVVAVVDGAQLHNDADGAVRADGRAV